MMRNSKFAVLGFDPLFVDDGVDYLGTLLNFTWILDLQYTLKYMIDLTT